MSAGTVRSSARRMTEPGFGAEVLLALLRANPSGMLRVASHRIPIVAELADDPERIAACSHGLREKYPTARGSLAEMLLDAVLPTTLEFEPA